MTVARPYDGVVKLGVDIGYVELGADKAVPRLLPRFGAFNDLEGVRGLLVLLLTTGTKLQKGEGMLGCHNHLRKDTVSIFVVVEEHRHLGIVAWRPVEELSEFSLHRLHCVFLGLYRLVMGSEGWIIGERMGGGRFVGVSREPVNRISNYGVLEYG